MLFGGLAAEERDHLGTGFLPVSQQQVAATRKAHKSSAGYVFCGVASVSECPVQVILRAEQKGGDADTLQIIARKRWADRRVVPNSLLPLTDGQNVLHHLKRSRLLLH